MFIIIFIFTFFVCYTFYPSRYPTDLDLIIVYDEYIIQPETRFYFILIEKRKKEYKINTNPVFCTRRLTRSHFVFFLGEKMHPNTKGNLRSMTVFDFASKSYENNNQSWLCHKMMTMTIIRIDLISFYFFLCLFLTKNIFHFVVFIQL